MVYFNHPPTQQSGSTKNEYAAKIALIQKVLDEPNVDLWKLRGLALSEGGLVNGEFVVAGLSIFFSWLLAALHCLMFEPN